MFLDWKIQYCISAQNTNKPMEQNRMIRRAHKWHLVYYRCGIHWSREQIVGQLDIHMRKMKLDFQL